MRQKIWLWGEFAYMDAMGKSAEMTVLQDAELKAYLLRMLAWFHAYCENHGLRYYAQGGTMLGAVRHQGFIPWDDDIDVGMPREDYERLIRLMAEEKSSRYVLETFRSEKKDFFYPFAKLYDTETTLIENTRCKIKRGIYLDIFPLDGIGNTQQEAVKRFRTVKKMRNLLLTLTTGVRKGRSIYKNAAVLIMRCVPAFALNPRKILASLDGFCSEKEFDNSLWVGNLMGNWMEQELMPRRVYGTPGLYPFESLQIYGPEDAESYLTHMYGDWRQLPPEEKRKSHHDYLFRDLGQSYLR